MNHALLGLRYSIRVADAFAIQNTENSGFLKVGTNTMIDVNSNAMTSSILRARPFFEQSPPIRRPFTASHVRPEALTKRRPLTILPAQRTVFLTDSGNTTDVSFTVASGGVDTVSLAGVRWLTAR